MNSASESRKIDIFIKIPAKACLGQRRWLESSVRYLIHARPLSQITDIWQETVFFIFWLVNLLQDACTCIVIRDLRLELQEDYKNDVFA